VPWDESQVSVGGLLGLGYGLRKKSKRKEEKRRSTNCAEGTLTESGSKWPKEWKRSEVRENESFNENIEEDRLARKMDRGQLSEQKKPPMDALKHLARKKERQAGEALKTWVKLT
jgi:hypothetical protein